MVLDKRRCFLFAAYYSDEIISDSDVYYLTELSKHGDVFVLIDNAKIDELELEKIAPYVVSTKVERHGEYDFGSWKRLLGSIDNNTLNLYSELFLVNNSVFLTGNLQQTLAEFSASDCSVLSSCVIDEHYIGNPIHNLDYLDKVDVYSESIMFPSFFLGFKKTVFTSEFFKSFMSCITIQPDRLHVCYAYERELTRAIFRLGFSVKLICPVIYSQAFIYKEIAFSLIKNGFPFMKKKIISSEYYSISIIEAHIRGLKYTVDPIIYNEIIGLTEKMGFSTLKVPEVEEKNISCIDKESKVERNFFFGKIKIKPTYTESKNSSYTHFDEAYYLCTNPDVRLANINALDHFMEYGWKERRAPNRYFSFESYSHFSNLALTDNSFVDYCLNGNIGYTEYLDRQLSNVDKISKAKDLKIFFNVAKDVIGGGMLSIDRFTKASSKLFHDSKDVMVCMSGLPLGNPAIEYSHFNSHLPLIDFTIIINHVMPETVTLFLPEIFAIGFFNSLDLIAKRWLFSSKCKIVILNQNTDLMPSYEKLIETDITNICSEVVITTAHKSYCSQAMSNEYGMPVKQLTPFLPEMKVRSFAEKEKIIMCSPDALRDEVSGLSSTDIIDLLKTNLPDYQVVIVNNLSLNEYLDLASRCMFSITFGEGLDGYFIEPILSQGVSFAVYNSAFFPKHFSQSEDLYKSWREFLEGILYDINLLGNDEGKYIERSKNLGLLLEKEYSNEISLAELRSLFNSEYDYIPSNVNNSLDISHSTQVNLEQETNLHNFSISSPAKCSLTSDGFFIEHSGGRAFDILNEVYINKLWDLELGENDYFSLIVIGAEEGIIPLYLCRKYPQIRNVINYEIAYPAANLTKNNFKRNHISATFTVKTVGIAEVASHNSGQYFEDIGYLCTEKNRHLVSSIRDKSRSIAKSIPYQEVSLACELLSIMNSAPSVKKIFVYNQDEPIYFLQNLEIQGFYNHIQILLVKCNSEDLDEVFHILSKNDFKCSSTTRMTNDNCLLVRAVKEG